MKKEALTSFETSAITQHHIPEDLNLLYKYNQIFAKQVAKASTWKDEEEKPDLKCDALKYYEAKIAIDLSHLSFPSQNYIHNGE